MERIEEKVLNEYIEYDDYYELHIINTSNFEAFRLACDFRENKLKEMKI